MSTLLRVDAVRKWEDARSLGLKMQRKYNAHLNEKASGCRPEVVSRAVRPERKTLQLRSVPLVSSKYLE